MKKEIRTETRFLWDFLKALITFPFILILSFFSKKYRQKLKNPFSEIIKFLLEAKITFVLLMLNIIVFFYEIFFMTTQQVDNVAVNATLFNPAAMLFTWFLHASYSHLLWNMLALLLFGRIVERNFKQKTWIIYFASALIGSLLSFVFEGPGIGASGAISGLVAAAILIEPFYRTFMSIIPMPVAIIGLGFILGDVFAVITPTVGDNVGHFAHLGGYLAISLLLFLFSKEQRKKMKWGLLINVVFVVLMMFLNFSV